MNRMSYFQCARGAHFCDYAKPLFQGKNTLPSHNCSVVFKTTYINYRTDAFKLRFTLSSGFLVSVISSLFLYLALLISNV